MLTKRDTDILIYIRSNGTIIKGGNDNHPYDIVELKELVTQNLLTEMDQTLPAPKGEHPNVGKKYSLTPRGHQIIDDWTESLSEKQTDKSLAQKTFTAAKISIVISVLSLISSLILSILSLILR